MINEENLNKILEGIIDNQELNTKNLNSFGLTSGDLTTLVKENYLERTKHGHYQLAQITPLYNYGRTLIIQKNYAKATQCFQKCHELDPNHLETCLQLLVRSVQEQNYELAIECLEQFSQVNDLLPEEDRNIYWYLLNMITNLPEKWQMYAKYLTINNISKEQNKMRFSIFQQKLYSASKQLNEIIQQQGRMSIQDIILRNLIDQALVVHNNNRTILIQLCVEKKYQEINQQLRDQEKRYKLSNYSKLVLQLIEHLDVIKKTKQIPLPQTPVSMKIEDLIASKNYSLALETVIKYSEDNNTPLEENVLYLLLTDITNFIDRLKNTDIDLKETIKEDLENQKIELALKKLDAYLDMTDQQFYKNLLHSLIKLSILNNDSTFQSPIKALEEISENNFQYKTGAYIKGFYEALAKDKLEQATLYLDIINEANQFEGSCPLVPLLKQMLAQAQDTKKENLKQAQSIDNIEEMKQYLRKAQENGIVIIEGLDETQIKRLEQIRIILPNFNAFTIGNEKKVVLKNCPYIPNIDIPKSLSTIRDAIKNKDYDTVIDANRQLISYQDRSINYANIGIGYLKKGNIEVAIDYLTVATELSKQEHTNYDYTKLIHELKETRLNVPNEYQPKTLK